MFQKADKKKNFSSTCFFFSLCFLFRRGFIFGPNFFERGKMEVAISSLISAFLSDYAPIESVGMKVAIGSLCSRLIEKYLPDANKIVQMCLPKRCCCRRRKKTSFFTIDVYDIFTAHAIDMFILNLNAHQLKQQCPEANNDDDIKISNNNDIYIGKSPNIKEEDNNDDDNQIKLLWDYDQIHCGSGHKTMVYFKNIPFIFIKMPDDENSNESGTTSRTDTSNHKKKLSSSLKNNDLLFVKNKKPVLFSVSSASTIENIQTFLFYIQSLMPNSLNVYRNSFSLKSFSSNRRKNYKKNSADDNDDMFNEMENFDMIFFNKLEHYFLQRDPIRCANLGYEGKESVFGANPFSFAHSVLYDNFNGLGEVKILFMYITNKLNKNGDDFTQTNQALVFNQVTQVDCIRFESNVLSVKQLRDYTQYIFKQMLAIEGQSILQKFIRVNEVETRGSSKRPSASWRSTCVATSKTFRNIVLSETVQKEFVQDLKTFLNSAQYYIDRGMPYKRTYLIYGPPGTGKSSSLKAVAREYGLEIFTCNLGNVTHSQFQSLMTEMDFKTQNTPHMLVFEDADRSKLFHCKKTQNKKMTFSRYCSRRNGQYDEDDDEEDGDESEDENDEDKKKSNNSIINKPVALDALLNVIDGLKEPYGRVTIFTMNNPQKFLKARENITNIVVLKNNENQNNNIENSQDYANSRRKRKKALNPLEAFMRPGRIDKVIEIGYCTKQQISCLFKIYFPDEPDLEENQICTFEGLSAAQLGETFMQCDALKARNILYGNLPFICINGEELIKSNPLHPDDAAAIIIVKQEEKEENKHEEKERDKQNVLSTTMQKTTKTKRKKQNNDMKQVSEEIGVPRVSTIIRELNALQKKQRNAARWFREGDEAVIRWRDKSQLWLQKISLADSVYQDLLERFVTSGSTEETKKKRGRPKKNIQQQQQITETEKKEKEETDLQNVQQEKEKLKESDNNNKENPELETYVDCVNDVTNEDETKKRQKEKNNNIQEEAKKAEAKKADNLSTSLSLHNKCEMKIESNSNKSNKIQQQSQPACIEKINIPKVVNEKKQEQIRKQEELIRNLKHTHAPQNVVKRAVEDLVKLKTIHKKK